MGQLRKELSKINPEESAAGVGVCMKNYHADKVERTLKLKNLKTYQHSGPEIKLMEELRYEYVYLQHVGDIFALHVTQDVDEPLEVLVGWTNPEEIYLWKCIVVSKMHNGLCFKWRCKSTFKCYQMTTFDLSQDT